MKAKTERFVFRWVHIVFGVPVVGYVYSPFETLPDFAWMIRWIFMPILICSGLWLWKGHVVRKLFTKQSA
jgi:hypothetical protein